MRTAEEHPPRAAAHNALGKSKRSKKSKHGRRDLSIKFVTIFGMRLGTLLLRDAIITLTQLEQSLRAQVLSGGLLGTNLVELGFIDLNTLGRYLARILDTPLAIADHLEKADPALIEAMGAAMADRYSAVPLHLDDEASGTVAVVMRDPTKLADIAALSKHLGHKVRACVAPELRIFYYLERYYGIRRRTRFTRAPEEETPVPKSRRERRATQPFRGSTQPNVVEISPQRGRQTPAPSRPPAMVEQACSFEEACKAVEAATHRNDIATAIMQFSIGRFECAAMFTVRSGQAMGWVAQAKGLGRDALERLSLPLAAASVFQSAHDSQKPYRGPAITPGAPLERQLWSIFALESQPGSIHVVPICMHNRAVNLIYAHNTTGAPPDGKHGSDLAELGKLAANVYERMVAGGDA